MGWSDYTTEDSTALTTKYRMQKSLMLAYNERIVCVQYFAWKQNRYYPTVTSSVFVTYGGKYYKSIPQETYPPYNYNQQPDISPIFWKESTYDKAIQTVYSDNRLIKDYTYFMVLFENYIDSIVTSFGYIESNVFTAWTLSSIYSYLGEERIDTRELKLLPKYYRKWYEQVIKIFNLLDTRIIDLRNGTNSNLAPSLDGNFKFAGNIPYARLAQYSKNNNGVLEVVDVPGGTSPAGTNALFDSSAEYAPVSAITVYGWAWGKYYGTALELGFEHYRINYDYNNAKFTNIFLSPVQGVYIKQKIEHYVDYALQPAETIYETQGSNSIVNINDNIAIAFNTNPPPDCPELNPPDFAYLKKNDILRYSNYEMYIKYNFEFIQGS